MTVYVMCILGRSRMAVDGAGELRVHSTGAGLPNGDKYADWRVDLEHRNPMWQRSRTRVEIPRNRHEPLCELQSPPEL